MDSLQQDQRLTKELDDLNKKYQELRKKNQEMQTKIKATEQKHSAQKSVQKGQKQEKVVPSAQKSVQKEVEQKIKQLKKLKQELEKKQKKQKETTQTKKTTTAQTHTNGRQYINVKFADKQDAKKLKARWDGQERKWYIPDYIQEENKKKLRNMYKPKKLDGTIQKLKKSKEKKRREYIDLGKFDWWTSDKIAAEKEIEKFGLAQYDDKFKEWYIPESLNQKDKEKIRKKYKIYLKSTKEYIDVDPEKEQQARKLKAEKDDVFGWYIPDTLNQEDKYKLRSRFEDIWDSVDKNIFHAEEQHWPDMFRALAIVGREKDYIYPKKQGKQEKQYIYVNYDMKEYAKQLKARWDGIEKSWYIPNNISQENKRQLRKMFGRKPKLREIKTKNGTLVVGDIFGFDAF